MSRIVTLFLATLLLVMPLSVGAQDEDNPPDYQVLLPSHRVSEDESEIVVTFSVYNKGGPADREATVELVDLSSGEVIATGSIRPLGGGGDREENATVTFPVNLFPAESQQILQIAVGVGEIEPEDSATIADNYAGISVPIPDYDPDAFAPPAAAPVEADEEDAAPASSVIVVPFLDAEIDLDDPEQRMIVAGIALVILLMLLIVLLILRVVFQRSPAFGNWQPPYATMPPLDPNSTYGRRQLWQQHAQNNVLPVPCKPGSIQARKVLLGMDGGYLSGWRIMALRMTQYDMYGRVSRSQVLAPRGAVRRLDRAARKAPELDRQQLSRRVRPAARALARRFRKKLNKRSAMLPVALDVRFQGTHGEVRILFELHECRQGQPDKIDHWEPEMTVLGKTIYESYTFTIYGQSGGESFREFRKRLQEDIERVLTDMLHFPIMAARAGPSPDSLTSTQPVQPVEVVEAQEQERPSGSNDLEGDTSAEETNNNQAMFSRPPDNNPS
jgi:hypothetical protein